MKYTYLFLFILSTQLLTAQSGDLIFVDGIDINEERYPDVKDSPYLFKDDWHTADLLTKEMKRVPNVSARYNMYTGEFEVRQDDKFIRLASDRFMRIEFEVDENGKEIESNDDKLIFQASFHPRFKDRFVNLIYSSKNMMLFRDFRSIISEKTVQNVGNTVEFKRFYTKTEYYLLQKGELKTFRVSKKNLIKLLGHKKELESFMKETKLDINSVSGLKKLFTFTESLG